MDLLLVDRTDEVPSAFLAGVGRVFARFGVHTQDSGNESFGVEVGGRRFFVKSTDPGLDVHCDHTTRVKFLRNAIELGHSCSHEALPRMHHVIESLHGPMLVYDWVDGELLGNKTQGADSPHERFRTLPSEEIVRVLSTVYELHDQLVAGGWIAVDFYDGCLIYDFASEIVHIIDLDMYHQGPFVNEMGRMFGSSRFMAPEEFIHGATIDERTTVFTMGRTAAVFLSDNSLERSSFRGNDDQYDVVIRACQEAPEDRFVSVRDLLAAWTSASNR